MWVALIQSVEHYKKNAVLFQGRENSPGRGRLPLDSSYNINSFLGLQPAGRLCRLRLASLHNFMSQLFKINPSLWVSLSFWRRTLTDTAFILIFLQQDYGSSYIQEITYWIANHEMPIKQFFPLLHLFPPHENLYTWEPQVSSSHLVSYFFFAFPISGGKWNLAAVTDKIDIATLKTPAFWLKSPWLPSSVSRKCCLLVLLLICISLLWALSKFTLWLNWDLHFDQNDIFDGMTQCPWDEVKYWALPRISHRNLFLSECTSTLTIVDISIYQALPTCKALSRWFTAIVSFCPVNYTQETLLIVALMLNSRF